MSGPVTRDDAPVDDLRERPAEDTFERFESREVDLAGMPVRRALPKRGRRTIGPWCFLDHFGPAGPGSLMQVGPHPHIGLQTVTWLLEGEVLHHDSLGYEQTIRPGQLNLMTAGSGIAHAEKTPPSTPHRQHGAQLWIAQPDATRDGEPSFEHHPELPALDRSGWTATVLCGRLEDAVSPARTDSPLVGAALRSPTASLTSLGLDPSFEHGLVVLRGEVAVGEQAVAPGQLVYLGSGRETLDLTSRGPVDAVLVGGPPFGEEVVMWWNFVARSRAEIAAARESWESADGRFGRTASRLDPISAPPLL